MNRTFLPPFSAMMFLVLVPAATAVGPEATTVPLPVFVTGTR